MMRTWQQASYRCEDGASIAVNTRGKIAHLKFKDQSYDMKQLDSDSTAGTTYSSGTVDWTVHGENAVLEEHANPEKTVTLAKGCRLESKSTEDGSSGAVKTPDPPGSQTSVVLSGTVSYLQRIAMPPSAVVTVTLQDVSLADAPAKIISKQTINFGDRQVPIPFELRFDKAQIDPQHLYSVAARIEVEGRVRFTSDSAHQVLTHGNPTSGVNLRLVPADSHP